MALSWKARWRGRLARACPGSDRGVALAADLQMVSEILAFRRQRHVPSDWEKSATSSSTWSVTIDRPNLRFLRTAGCGRVPSPACAVPRRPAATCCPRRSPPLSRQGRWAWRTLLRRRPGPRPPKDQVIAVVLAFQLAQQILDRIGSCRGPDGRSERAFSRCVLPIRRPAARRRTPPSGRRRPLRLSKLARVVSFDEAPDHPLAQGHLGDRTDRPAGFRVFGDRAAGHPRRPSTDDRDDLPVPADEISTETFPSSGTNLTR